MGARVLRERYELTREIGRGAMGAVHDAWDRELERRVAVKTLAGRQVGAETRARFVREAKLLARVHDPHVVSVFDAGNDDDEPYIVMELLFGTSLSARIKEKGRLAWRDAVGIGVEIARGLSAVHAAGLVHRDLKPANVFLARIGDREIAKVLDLGVARATDETSLTQSGAIVGTAIYLAPEQIQGGDLDARADVYGFGVALFEMLAGKPPFLGPSIVETIHAHLYDPMPPLDSKVPAPVAAVVKRCLAKKPADRYPTARAVQEALAALLEPAREGATVAVGFELPALEAEPAPTVRKPEVKEEAPPLDAATAELLVGGPELDVPPAEPAPELASASEELMGPLSVERLAVERPAPRPLEFDAAGEALLDLEVDVSPAPQQAIVHAPPPLAAPAYAAPLPQRAPPVQRLAPPPREPGPLAGVFAVLPAAVHQRLALGATVIAFGALLLTGSFLIFCACMLLALFGLVGYFVRRRLDGED